MHISTTMKTAELDFTGAGAGAGVRLTSVESAPPARRRVASS